MSRRKLKIIIGIYTDGLNEELEPFIIDISSNTSDDDITDGGEDVDSMEEGDSAEDVCSYKSMFFVIKSFVILH